MKLLYAIPSQEILPWLSQVASQLVATRGGQPLLYK